MFYHIILGNKHIDLIRASSEEDAIKKIEKTFGPAEKLSKNHKYRAVEA